MQHMNHANNCTLILFANMLTLHHYSNEWKLDEYHYLALVDPKHLRWTFEGPAGIGLTLPLPDVLQRFLKDVRWYFIASAK
jgi:hypothetical protein